MSIYTKVFGQAWATDWQAGLTAPFVEETSKGAIFLLLMGLAPVVIRTVSDGLIVGAYVGLGFQILEDVFYAQNAAFEQFGAHQSDAVLAHLHPARDHRHPVARALHRAVRRRPDLPDRHARPAPARRARAWRSCSRRSLMHGVLGLGGRDRRRRRSSLVVLLATTVFCVVALLRRDPLGRAAASARSCATSWPRRWPAGTITAAELEALTGHRHERRAAVKTRADGVCRRREKHVLRAARDLAEDLARGDETAIQHSRAEIARLRGA